MYEPELRIVKDFDSSTVVVGSNTSFTLTVFNDGSGNAYGVTITDLLEDEFSFLNAVPYAPVVNGQLLTWDDIEIPAGGSWSTVVNVALDDDNSLSGSVLCNT